MVKIDWQHEEESDHFDLDSPTELTRVLEQTEGGIYLKHLEQKLAVDWNSNYAVITHQIGEATDFEYPMTLEALEEFECDFDHDSTLQWVCGCCGVSLGYFPVDHHLPRDVGLRIFDKFLRSGERPMSDHERAIIWTKIDV